jgi:integrase
VSRVFRRTRKLPDGKVVEGKTWWISYFDHAKDRTVDESAKTEDHKAATALLRRRERESAAPDSAAHTAPLSVAFADFVDKKKRAGKTAGTLHMYHKKARHLARLLGKDVPLRGIRAKHVEEYIKTRQDEGAKNTTINLELVTLRGILKLAHTRELCGPPTEVMPTDFSAKYVPLERHVRSYEDLESLVNNLPAHRKAHVLYIVATAADWGPSFETRRRDIDLELGRVLVHGRKNEFRQRVLPITPEMRALLEQVLESAPNRDRLFDPWKNQVRDLAIACAKAGIPRVTARDLRRTFGKWLRNQGHVSETIGAAMGHRDGRMAAKVYAPIEPENLRELLMPKSNTEKKQSMLARRMRRRVDWRLRGRPRKQREKLGGDGDGNA